MPFHAGDDRSAKSQIPRIAAIQGVERENLLSPQFPPKITKNLQQIGQILHKKLDDFGVKIQTKIFEFWRQIQIFTILAQKFKVDTFWSNLYFGAKIQTVPSRIL